MNNILARSGIIFKASAQRLPQLLAEVKKTKESTSNGIVATRTYNYHWSVRYSTYVT
jgi:hypothetical protein